MLGLGNNLTHRNFAKGSDGNVPINVVAPSISGTALVGNTLTSTTGTWTSDTGVIGYLYQWYRGATLISGATNSTYVLTFADGGFDITCRVAATDTDGTSAYVSSNSILAIDTRLIFSVKTDNTGSSLSNQFTIPTTGTGYNYNITTSDGQSIAGLTSGTTITFPSAGTYDIFISGSFPQFFFNNVGDRMKLLNLKNFGIYAQGSTSQNGAFFGCSNLIISATDTGYFENVTNFTAIFRNCSSITSFPQINTSSGNDFSLSFFGMTSLNTFPTLNFNSSTIFNQSWRNSALLNSFPSNLFNNSIATNYSDAFTSTNLSQSSIDNVLVSIDISGSINGNFRQTGGSTPSATGLTAKANLITKGWTVITT